MSRSHWRACDSGSAFMARSWTKHEARPLAAPEWLAVGVGRGDTPQVGLAGLPPRPKERRQRGVRTAAGQERAGRECRVAVKVVGRITGRTRGWPEELQLIGHRAIDGRPAGSTAGADGLVI